MFESNCQLKNIQTSIIEPLEWQKSVFPLQMSEISFQDFLYFKGIKEQKIQCLLGRSYLAYYSKKGHLKWINYENSTLEISTDDSGMKWLNLTKANSKIIMQCENLEIWFNYMRKYCFQNNFQSQYSLVKKIGKGHFADVYLARHKNDLGTYAVKIFEKCKISEQIDQQSFFKEIHILRSLNSQLLLKIHEVYETKNHICIVTEIMNGGELHQFLEKNGAQSENQTANLMYHLLLATLNIHQKGIIHRDLKPENILLRNKEQLSNVCIADFGLADFYNVEGHYLFTRCGTPGYVAPELLQDKVYDYKIDVYSLGIIMYIALTGKEPFDGQYTEKVIKNYKGKIDFSQVTISRVGMNFLMGMLEFNPEKRMTIKDALGHEWFKQERIIKQNNPCIKNRTSIKCLQSHKLNLKSPLASYISLESYHSQNSQSPLETASNSPQNNEGNSHKEILKMSKFKQYDLVSPFGQNNSPQSSKSKNLKCGFTERCKELYGIGNDEYKQKASQNQAHLPPIEKMKNLKQNNKPKQF